MQPLWWIMRDIVFDEHYVNYGYAFAFKDTPKSYALSDAFWVLVLFHLASGLAANIGLAKMSRQCLGFHVRRELR